jgi:hypothetical protein
MAKTRIDPKLPIAPTSGPWSDLMRPDGFGDRLVRRLNELFYDLSGTDDVVVPPPIYQDPCYWMEAIHGNNPPDGTGTTSPLTTKGDVWGFSTTNARIPVGADTFVLTADSAQVLGVKWAAATGGGGSPAYAWFIS